jgi:hypothetical protein
MKIFARPQCGASDEILMNLYSSYRISPGLDLIEVELIPSRRSDVSMTYLLNSEYEVLAEIKKYYHSSGRMVIYPPS